jgi:Cu-Zn family superoxide dismutase
MTFRHLSILSLSLFLFSCSQPASTETKTEVEKTVEEKIETMKPKVAISRLQAKNNSGLNGKVIFTEMDGKVRMEAAFSGVSQGIHAIHIHETGDCSSEDGKSAGGHWNPTGEDHGKWGVPPFHRGDIGNFEADKNGLAKMTMPYTELWCVGCGDEKRDIIGKAIIIHAGEDDCKSQPSGAAGARIACGEISLN